MVQREKARSVKKKGNVGREGGSDVKYRGTDESSDGGGLEDKSDGIWWAEY
jgi:hypothetical protein